MHSGQYCKSLQNRYLLRLIDHCLMNSACSMFNIGQPIFQGNWPILAVHLPCTLLYICLPRIVGLFDDLFMHTSQHWSTTKTLLFQALTFQAVHLVNALDMYTDQYWTANFLG